MESESFKSLPPAVAINMDNFKPYSNIRELKEKVLKYMKSLQAKEFSLEESNPDIKFKLSKQGIKHTLYKAGETKMIILKQLPEIFKQAIVVGVEDEKSGNQNIEHILICQTYIMVNGKLFVITFHLKMQKDKRIYFYDGAFDADKPEEEKTALD